MTEDQARAALADVPRETFAVIERFVDLVIDHAARQNLVARSTIDHIWERHVLDSHQLLRLQPERAGAWIDIGTGAGFPGMIAAIVTKRPVMLVESRRLRVEFLRLAVETLGLANVTIAPMRIEMLRATPAAIISARAVAPLARLFAAAAHVANPATVWILPKGRNAASELAEAKAAWHGDFAMHPSLTDPEASIVVARQVRARGVRR